MVTAVKYRKALLNSEIEECITETLKGISERYEIIIDEVGFDQNHIHIFCGAPPRMAPLRVISIIKSITARKIFERFPNLKKHELWGGEFWSDGYFASTVSKHGDENTVANYVKQQGQTYEKLHENRQLKLF